MTMICLEKSPPATNFENIVSMLLRGYFTRHDWGSGVAQTQMQDHAHPSSPFPPIFPRFLFL